MQKKVVQEALELTRECLSRYWKLDPELVISCCAEDVLWTGALQKQFIVGKEATAEDLRGTMRDLKPCHLMNRSFLWYRIREPSVRWLDGIWLQPMRA